MEVKIVKIPMFDPLAGQEPTPTVIEITEPLPSFLPQKQSLEDWEYYCDEQAAALEHALFNSISQGIYDRLIGIMFKRKASLYRGKTR